MKSTADELAQFAGGVIGARIGGPSGRLIGAAVAPTIIERGALAIRDVIKKPRKQSPAQKRRSKNMSKAMTKANEKAKLKNGSWRKGWNQKRLMEYAHKVCE
jgi:hypothetical protein